MKSLLTLSLSILTTVLVASAGAQEMRVVGPGGISHTGSRVVVKGNGKLIEHLTKTLKLTPAQVKKVSAQQDAMMKRLQAAKSQDDFPKIFAWNKAEMKKILTPEQFAKYESTMQFKMKKA
jgi:Spy/CpxP family protein refolding chaperone